MRIMEEAFDYLDAPVKRVAAVDVPVPYNRILEDAALPNVEDIISGVREVLA
jgi:pyruvate dehydrogenase E1 component beta subunit